MTVRELVYPDPGQGDGVNTCACEGCGDARCVCLILEEDGACTDCGLPMTPERVAWLREGRLPRLRSDAPAGRLKFTDGQ